jgi:hypothetical protein
MELRWHSVLALSLSLFTLNSFLGQAPNVNWGPLEPTQGSLLEIVPIKSTDFYTLRYSGGILGSYRLTLHNQLSYVSHQKIKPITESGIGTIESATFFAKKFQVLISDRSNSEMNLFSQAFDQDSRGESILRCGYTDQRLGAKPNFNFMVSQNRNFFLVYYEIPGKRENRDVYGYTLFDSTFNEIKRGEYLLPFDGNLSTINEHHVTNQGEYLLVVTEHKDKNDRFFGRDWENFKALHVFKINKDTLKEFYVNINDKRIDDIAISSNNENRVALTGLYGTGNQSGIQGIFTITLDTGKDSILNYSYAPFNRDILKESRTERQMNRLEKRSENVGETPQIYSYKLRQIRTLADGSQLGFMEQYYVRRITNYDTRTGITTVNYHYYFMDIVAFKMDENGRFAWEKRIPKSQVSINDNGSFSSFVAFNNENKAYLIFNDNQKNYDELGTFDRVDEAVAPFTLAPNKNAIAIVTLDVKDGAIRRESLTTRKELSAISIPKLMKVDWKNQQVLLYAMNRNRERFGILSFK